MTTFANDTQGGQQPWGNCNMALVMAELGLGRARQVRDGEGPSVELLAAYNWSVLSTGECGPPGYAGDSAWPAHSSASHVPAPRVSQHTLTLSETRVHAPAAARVSYPF